MRDIHQVSTSQPSRPGLALPVADDDAGRAAARPDGRGRGGAVAHVRSRRPYVTEAASHLLDAGGKRFRPLLVLLAAEAGDAPGVDDVVTAACVVEITHLGSLYHDDVMDEADLRRGADVGQRPLGQPGRDPHRRLPVREVLRADRPARAPTPCASRPQTFTRLVEGQILETVEPGPDEDPLAHYLEVVAGKTGSLIATSARYGARFGGATPEVEEALDGVRRDRRLGLPALRRHPRRRLRVGRVRQDPRHRPARGRADAAGAAWPRRSDRPRRRPAARAARRPTSPTTPCTPRRSPCCGRTPPWTRPAPTSSPAPPRPRPCSACSPPARSAPPSRPSPTWSPPAPS